MHSSKLNLCLAYIEIHAYINEITDKVNVAFEEIHEDNRVVSVVPPRVTQFIDNLMRELLTEEEFDWLDWWLWEAEHNPKIGNIVTINSIEYEVTSFEELYELLFSRD